MQPHDPQAQQGTAPIMTLHEEVVRLRRENAMLRQRDTELVNYLRHKVDQLLAVIGTLPLHSEELDDASLIAFDPIGIVAETFSQILETQRQTSDRLGLARDEISAIFNSVGAGIVVLDRERHILSCNDRLKEQFFSGRRRVIGQDCVSILCRAKSPPPACVFNKVLASAERASSRDWAFGERFFDVVGAPVKDRRGQVQQVVIVYHEVTDRKLAEQELCLALEQAWEAREHTDAIVRAVNEGMLVADCNGILLLANPAAAQMLGRDASALVGKHLRDILPGAALADLMAQACVSGEPGEPFDLTFAEAKASRSRCYQARLALLHTSDGAIRGGIVTLRDVTREREVERMKSNFVSTAAHELRTPLASILGFSELLLDPQAFSAGEVGEFVSLIHGKAEKLSELIDELLDISRIEAGIDMPLQREAVPLGPLAEASVDFFRHSAPQHHFELVLPPLPPVVYADPRRIAQVFDNLLSNAVKYSPGGGTVTVQLQADEKRCTVAIRDQGIGMSDEEVARIFDKFYRVDVTNTAVPGVGLGMTIVKQLIDSHDGEISVASVPGQGTTISFSLPVWIGEV